MSGSLSAEQLLASVDVSLMMDAVSGLCRLDRYQASEGINAAADLLAVALAGEGADVAVERRPVPPGSGWVGFDAPTSWSPGRVGVALPEGPALDRERDGFLAAVHSAPLAAGTYSLECWEGGPARPDGLYLLPASRFDASAFAAAGGRAFVTDAGAKPTGSGDHAGRVELPSGTRLTGFSVSTPDFVRFCQSAAKGGAAFAVFEARSGASMPVLEAVVPGVVEGEIWVMAHICHLRPGANDNASGVAGLLGLARSLKHLGRAHATIRLIAGPEFTGISALLDRHARLPAAVLNLDMIGQDTDQCGGLFRVERDPGRDSLPLVAQAETSVGKVFAAAGLDWSPMPFHGYSDNAVFAAGGCRVPTVQFCHDHDVYNHSAGDTLDRLSPTKMAAAVAAAADLVTGLDTSATGEISAEWLASERRAIAARADYWRLNGAAEWAGRFEAERTATLEQGTPIMQPSPSHRLVPGPLNLRGLLGQLDVELRQALGRRISSEKAFYARLLNSVVAFEAACEVETALDRASFVLGMPFDGVDRELLGRAIDALAADGRGVPS